MTNIKEKMNAKDIKTVLFAGLIMTLMVPVFGMNNVYAQEDESEKEKIEIKGTWNEQSTVQPEEEEPINSETEIVDEKTKQKITQLIQEFWKLEETRIDLHDQLRETMENDGNKKLVESIEQEISTVNESLESLDAKIQELSAPITEEHKMEKTPIDSAAVSANAIWGNFQKTVPMTGCGGHNETFTFYGNMESGAKSFWFTHQFPSDVRTGVSPNCTSHDWDDYLFLEAKAVFGGNSCSANWTVSEYASNQANCGTAFYAPDFVRITAIGDYEHNQSRGDITYVQWF